MDIVTLLQSSPALLLFVTAILGLLIGSFLNVVIFRLPVMLHRRWGEQCREYLTPEQAAAAQPEKFNLLTPRSRCPHCGKPIAAWENIPILSYLLLRGRCARCKTPISIRYPLIEALTALLSVLVVWQFGFSWTAGAALLLTWALVALTFIDFDHQLLPDDITLPFLWLGILLALFGLFTDLQSAVIGAVAGYLVLWSVYQLFKAVTGKEGMGYGDFKLLGMLGAWLGWQALPVVILLSSVVGAVVGIALVVLRRHGREVPIPFGPYLAAAGWIALMWGERLTEAYRNWAGL